MASRFFVHEAKMNISLQEAIDSLHKWQREKRIIQCYFRDRDDRDESSCSVIGRIEEMTAQTVRVTANSFNTLRGDLFGCFVVFTAASEFSLIDCASLPKGQGIQDTIREMYDHILAIRLNSGSMCEFRSVKLSVEIKNIVLR
jgi:hypothetical protein